MRPMFGFTKPDTLEYIKAIEILHQTECAFIPNFSNIAKISYIAFLFSPPSCRAC